MERIVCSAEDAAKMLGTRPNTVQSLLEAGEIPAYKEGRNWKIPYTLLQKYVEDKAITETNERRKKNGSGRN